MNLSEFKAWFEGFTEGMDAPPDAKQWKRIKAKIADIVDAPTTREVFVERYRYYPPIWWNTSGAGVGAVAYSGAQGGVMAQSAMAAQGWNSAEAFRALGRADSQTAA